MVTSTICATNNRAETSLNAFIKGVQKFGLPSRVRGDCGTENNGIENYMQEQQGYAGAYIRGPSVHNQRIERLHYDTTHCALAHFINVFTFLEDHGLLSLSDEGDLFSLHYCFT